MDKNIFRELRNKLIDDRIALTKKYIEAVSDELKKYKLNNLVKRKDDGKIGYLKIQNDRVQFFPIKKDGTMSLIKNGYILNVLKEFEPYNEESEV